MDVVAERRAEIGAVGWSLVGIVLAVIIPLLVGCADQDPTSVAPDGDVVVSPTSSAGARPDGVEQDDDQGQAAAPTTGDAEPGDGSAEGRDRSIPVPTVTTIDLDALEGAELEDFLASRYEAFWAAFGQARAAPSDRPSIDHPSLADLAADEQLDQANAELEELAADGLALRRPEVPAVPGLDQDSAHRIRVERVDDASAELTICFVNDQVSYRVDDGAVLRDDVVTVTATATMVRTDDTWKLIRSRAIALDPGVAGCWLEGEDAYPW